MTHRYAETHTCTPTLLQTFLVPYQVINAALTLAARPQSKVAQDNMDVFKDQWEKQVRILTEAVDDITSVDDFLSVSGMSQHKFLTDWLIEANGPHAPDFPLKQVSYWMLLLVSSGTKFSQKISMEAWCEKQNYYLVNKKIRNHSIWSKIQWTRKKTHQKAEEKSFFFGQGWDGVQKKQQVLNFIHNQHVSWRNKLNSVSTVHIQR